MLQKIENMIFDGPSRDGIKFLKKPDYKGSKGLRRLVLKQMRQEFQIVPPITIHISNSKLMAANWTFSREVLIAGSYARADRELVAAITSQINQCPFCVEIHTSMLYGAGDKTGVDAIVAGKTNDKRKMALVDWARSTLTPNAPALTNPHFNETDKPYLIGTVLAFHYTNRMVNVFLEDSPLPVKISNKWLKSLSGRLIGFIAGRRIVSIAAKPGQSVYSDDEAILPDDFAWARANVPIARAVASFAKIAHVAGDSSLSAKARQSVLSVVDNWNGEHMPMGRAWIDEPLAPLSKADRPAAELALLTALASYRVTEKLIAEFRRERPDDLDLINVTSWGAFIAMRRISTWIDGNDTASS